MAHQLEKAKSGRATCRTCRQKIEKDAWRFGEEVANAFDPDGGTTHQWHHLMCAAQKKPFQLREGMAALSEPLPSDIMVPLEEALAQGEATARPPFPYAELASTGRARCQACRKPLEKGALRVAVARPMDAMPSEAPMYLHPGCAPGHTQNAELAEQLQKHSRLGADQMQALLAALQQPPLQDG